MSTPENKEGREAKCMGKEQEEANKVNILIWIFN